MKVRVQKLKGLTNELVLPDSMDRVDYPQPKNPALPRNFWLCVAAGQRGSGKTALSIRLLKDMETSGMVTPSGKPVPQRLILITPTYAANPAFKQLKHLDGKDIHNNYTDKLLVDIVEEIKADREATINYGKAIKLWKQFLKLIKQDKDPLKIMDKEHLKLLSCQTNGFRDDPVVPPHPLGCVVTLVLDDLLGTPAFSLNRGNYLGQVACNSRHWFLNVLILTQRLKQVVPLIRANITLLMLWRCMSKAIIVEEMYPVVSSLLTEEQFLALYAAATQGNKFDAFTVDTTATDPKHLFRINLDKAISLSGAQ